MTTTDAPDNPPPQYSDTSTPLPAEPYWESPQFPLARLPRPKPDHRKLLLVGIVAFILAGVGAAVVYVGRQQAKMISEADYVTSVQANTTTVTSSGPNGRHRRDHRSRGETSVSRVWGTG